MVWPYGGAIEKRAVARHRLLPCTFAIMMPVTTFPSCHPHGVIAEGPIHTQGSEVGRRGLRQC